MQYNTTDLNYEEEVKLAKFESLIDNIKNQINYYYKPFKPFFGIALDSVSSIYGSMIPSAISNNTKSSIVPTGIIPFIFNAMELNSYSDIINQKFTADIRSKILSNSANFNFDVPEDIKERISKLKELISQVKKEHSYSIVFIFALFMALAVDKTDYEKRLSTICDVAVMLEVTDDEMADIVQVVRYVYRDIKAEDVALKTDMCKQVFRNIVVCTTSPTPPTAFQKKINKIMNSRW